VVVDRPLADDRLGDAADVRIAGDGRYLHLHLQAYFTIWMDARRNVHVDANFLILKLGVDQWIDEASSRSRANAHASLEASRGNWHFVTDAQLGWLAVHRANFRVLNDFGRRISEQRVSGE